MGLNNPICIVDIYKLGIAHIKLSNGLNRGLDFFLLELIKVQSHGDTKTLPPKHVLNFLRNFGEVKIEPRLTKFDLSCWHS